MFDIARRVQWLSFLAGCANSVTREERFRRWYESEAVMVNQDMRKLSRLVKRDLSKYNLPEGPTTTELMANKLMSVLLSMELVLQERSDGVSGANMSCSESDF